MKRRSNKIKMTSLLLAALMLLSIGRVLTANAALPPDPFAVVAVEAFSIGNGYAVAPRPVSFKEGENGAQILDRVLKEAGLAHNYGGSLTDQYYLKSIGFENTDKIPQCVLDHIGDYIDEGSGSTLGEQDYTALSGWLFTVNGAPLQVSLNDYYPKRSDILRVQYSLWYGADIGLANAMEMDKWMGISDFYPAVQKDELTDQLSVVGTNDDLSDETLKKAYDGAMTAVQQLDISQQDVDHALYELIFAEYPYFVRGDVAGDLEVNVADVLAIQKYIAQVNTLDIFDRAKADFNQDGVISVADVVAIQRLIAKA